MLKTTPKPVQISCHDMPFPCHLTLFGVARRGTSVAQAGHKHLNLLKNRYFLDILHKTTKNAPNPLIKKALEAVCSQLQDVCTLMRVQDPSSLLPVLHVTKAKGWLPLYALGCEAAQCVSYSEWPCSFRHPFPLSKKPNGLTTEALTSPTVASRLCHGHSLTLTGKLWMLSNCPHPPLDQEAIHRLLLEMVRALIVSLMSLRLLKLDRRATMQSTTLRTACPPSHPVN